MATDSTISITGPNSGLQIGQHNGTITALLNSSSVQDSFETSENQDCLRDLSITNSYDDKDRIEAAKGGLLK
ncbi:hypothetical protein N7495_004873 [Penicillium taxi]|uniref:uncharacterized protein n=1 Tax=Penicillium taxi TaxID=168475 RepID=UPI0025452CB7|nr:uncharacterized protein N7495_004873 [Penicillium taxi]KAJ5900129.1 hypothetical protein N7495_004873 [Penicillium taxi]